MNKGILKVRAMNIKGWDGVTSEELDKALKRFEELAEQIYINDKQDAPKEKDSETN